MADQGNITSALTVADLNTKVNHEPRIADLRLAAALGFSDQHMIRRLIERHRPALERFGIILTTADRISVTVTENTNRRGRPGKTYWLNKKQALYLCTKSEAPLATETTIQMVEVFDEYLTGTLRPVKVKAHRRSLPNREPARFETPSEVLLDLLQAVRSSSHRMSRDPTLPFGTALAETLEDIMARRADPLAQTRGVMFDWNHRRASEDLYFKLKAQGRDVKYPTMPRTVPPHEYGARTEH